MCPIAGIKASQDIYQTLVLFLFFVSKNSKMSTAFKFVEPSEKWLANLFEAVGKFCRDDLF